MIFLLSIVFGYIGLNLGAMIFKHDYSVLMCAFIGFSAPYAFALEKVLKATRIKNDNEEQIE